MIIRGHIKSAERRNGRLFACGRVVKIAPEPNQMGFGESMFSTPAQIVNGLMVDAVRYEDLLIELCDL